jgi:hypothetical protein
MKQFMIGLFILVILIPANTTLPQSKKELPNDFNIELLGRCVIYSFSYQRLVTEQIGLEAGFSLLGGNGESLVFFSGGGRLYLLPGNASPCVGGGIVVVSAPTDSGPFSSDNSASYGYIGPGFEYRSSVGLMFRGSLYFLIAGGNFFTWPGLQLGIAF